MGCHVTYLEIRNTIDVIPDAPTRLHIIFPLFSVSCHTHLHGPTVNGSCNVPKFALPLCHIIVDDAQRDEEPRQRGFGMLFLQSLTTIDQFPVRERIFVSTTTFRLGSPFCLLCSPACNGVPFLWLKEAGWGRARMTIYVHPRPKPSIPAALPPRLVHYTA